MKKITRVLLVALVCALGIGCASSTTMTGIWNDPSFSGTSGGKVLVLGIGATEIGTRMFENAMATQLVAQKMAAVKGSEIFPINAPIDTLALRDYVTKNQIDLLSVTRLLDVSTKQEFVPGSTEYIPASGYHYWGGYYAGSYAVVHTPGYMRESKVGIVETNVYSAKTSSLVWSGQSETVDPASLEEAVDGISKTLVTNMAKTGLFGVKK